MTQSDPADADMSTPPIEPEDFDWIIVRHQKLQLSEAQVNQIEQSFLNHRRELADRDAALKSGETQLKTLMQADPINEKEIRTQTDRVASQRAALEKANASMMLSFRKALSNEQWKKLEEIQALRKMPFFSVVTAFPADERSSEEGKSTAISGPLPGRVYHIGEGITPPKCIHQPVPSYRPEARAARIEGIVLLQVIIRKDGTVGDVKVLRGLGYGLDESAADTIRNDWRFEPGKLNGQPVDVQANIEVSFRLY